MALQMALVLPYIAKALAAAKAAAPGAAKVAGAVGSIASKAKGMRLARGMVGNAVNGIVSAAGLPYLGMDGGKKFMDSAMYFFLSRYLPQMLSQGGLGGTKIGQLLLGYDKMMPGDRGFVMVGDGELRHPWDTREFTLGQEKPCVSGPWGRGPNGGDGSGPGGPVGKWFGGMPGTAQRTFGWGGSAGSGGWSAEELLQKMFESAMSASGQQVNPQAAIGASPYAEEVAYRDFLREQKAKDAEFDAKLRQKIDKDRQEYVDEKMRKHYRKPKSQWAKELVAEGAGSIAQILGEGFNIYNSALANALMQSASNAMTQRQAEMYGNPLMSGMPLLAGGRQAMGGIMDSVGKHIGNLLKNWSDNIATEFDTQRIMRLQLDNRQPGQVIDTIGRIGMRREKVRRD